MIGFLSVINNNFKIQFGYVVPTSADTTITLPLTMAPENGYWCAYGTVIDWGDNVLCNITVGFPAGDGSKLNIRIAYTAGGNWFGYATPFYWLVLGI